MSSFEFKITLHIDMPKSERIVFNIKGNDYRLVVAADFEKRIIWIKWIGTHGEYDQIDVTKVQYGRK